MTVNQSDKFLRRQVLRLDICELNLSLKRVLKSCFFFLFKFAIQNRINFFAEVSTKNDRNIKEAIDGFLKYFRILKYEIIIQNLIEYKII